MHDVLTQAARLITPYKLRSYQLMQIETGNRVLDMGCGGGVDTTQLAQIVGQAGRVVGIDRDQPSLQRARAAGQGAEHLMALAESLPFRAASFDACRSDRVFQHLPEPERAVQELRRVTRPGGWVVLAESDYGTYTQDSSEPELHARIARHLFSSRLADGQVGRKLHGLLARAGFDVVEAEAFPICITNAALFRLVADWENNRRRALEQRVVSAEEMARLEASHAAADEQGRFRCSFDVIVAAGRRPTSP